MAKINSAKLIVDNYDIKEIVKFLADEMPRIRQTADEGARTQNIALTSIAITNYVTVESIINALDEKLNGKKEKTVVQ